MAVEARANDAEVRTEDVEGSTVVEQVFDGADVAIVGTPFEERGAGRVRLGGGIARSQILENEVGAAIRDALNRVQRCPPTVSR